MLTRTVVRVKSPPAAAAGHFFFALPLDFGRARRTLSREVRGPARADNDGMSL
jgi:hypothetical protein